MSAISGREPVLLDVTLKYASAEEFELGFAPNLSAQAVFLKTKSPKPVGTPVRVQLHLRGGAVVLAGEGRVQWSHPGDATPPGRQPGMGIMFRPDGDESRTRVRRMLERSGEGSAARLPGARLGVQPASRPTATAPSSVAAAELVPVTPAPTRPPARRLRSMHGTDDDLGSALGDAFAAITTADAIPMPQTSHVGATPPPLPPRPAAKLRAAAEPEWLDTAEIELLDGGSAALPADNAQSAEAVPRPAQTFIVVEAAPTPTAPLVPVDVAPAPLTPVIGTEPGPVAPGPPPAPLVLDEPQPPVDSVGNIDTGLAAPPAGPAVPLMDQGSGATRETSTELAAPAVVVRSLDAPGAAPDVEHAAYQVAAPAADGPVADAPPTSSQPPATAQPEDALDTEPVEVTQQTAAPPPLRPQDRVATGLTPEIAGQRVGEVDLERLHGRVTLGPAGVSTATPTFVGWYWIVGVSLAEPFAPQPLQWPEQGTKRPISKIPPMLEDDLWSKLTDEQAPTDWTVRVLEASPGVLAADADLPLPLKSLAAAQTLEAATQPAPTPAPAPAVAPPAGDDPEAEVFVTSVEGELELLEQSGQELPQPRDVPVDDGEFLSWGEEVFTLGDRAPTAGPEAAAGSVDPDPAIATQPAPTLDALAAAEFVPATLPGAVSEQDDDAVAETTQPGTPSPFALEDGAAAAVGHESLSPWDPPSAALPALESTSTDDTTPGVLSPFLEADTSAEATGQEEPRSPEPAAGPFAALLAVTAAAAAPAAVEDSADDDAVLAAPPGVAAGADDAHDFDVSSDVIVTKPAAAPPAASPQAPAANPAASQPGSGVFGKLKRLFGGSG